MSSRLSDVQQRVLATIAGLQPPPVLTGGAALVGFYTFHRTTRDLDAFWRGRERLGEVTHLVRDRLATCGFEVSVLQSTPAFARLRVKSGEEVCLLDLVAEPVGALEPPQFRSVLGATVRIDSAHEILVNKLCTLIERAELRDLADVQALVDAGGDLARALEDAPRKDGGFSPLTLAWVLETTPFDATVEHGALDIDLPAVLQFRRRLIDLLTYR